MHPAALDEAELLKQCRVRFTRRSGPGGQHRNKVETAAVLLHEPTGVQAEANERRSQRENREAALFRLRVKLAVDVRTPLADDLEPSLLWNSRLRGGRIAVSASHQDFPALLAEALDVLSACDGDMPRAAQWLGCTASQLTRLIQQAPEAMLAVNAERKRRGLRVLK